MSGMNAYACENFLSEYGFLLVSEYDFFFLVIRIESLLHVGCYNIFYIFTTQECEHSESLLHVSCHNIFYTFWHRNLSTLLCCVYMPPRLVQHIPAAQECTGWRRCIGCLKLQVIFHKRANNYGAFRKMTFVMKSEI